MGSIVIGFVWSLSSSFLHLLMLLSGIWKDVYHSGHRFDTSDWFFFAFIRSCAPDSSVQDILEVILPVDNSLSLSISSRL